MIENPLLRLQEYGQSVWLDSLSRNLIRTGRLSQLIELDGLSGVTSNPSIFEKDIDGSDDYDSDIGRLRNQGLPPEQIYEKLVIADVQEAADLLRPVYDRTGGIDGYVSLEVSPALAHDTAGTIREGKRFWKAVNRPNALIKIPATKEGLPAIAQCLAEGVNINVTLLFGLPRYKEVAEAFLLGLEQRAQQNGDLRNLRSVASFFVSRIDVLIDEKLDVIGLAGWQAGYDARELRGCAAIASAKIAYQIYKEIFNSGRFRKLQERGARKQWLLWASTSTKTKEYSDVKYVEALIGPETINTMPLETLEAYRDHGAPAPRLEQGIEEGHETMRKLAEMGINIDEMTQQLEDEGVDKFLKPFNKMIQRLAQKAALTPAS